MSTPKLRARSAALSKLIVRTEQNNFAGGGTVAGLVPWAPVAARRAEVRTSGPNLVPPRSMWNKCFGRRKRTTIFCTAPPKTPRAKGRSAALSGERGGRGTFRGTARGSVATPPVPAQCVRRPGRGGRRNGYFKRLPWSKVPLLKTGAQSEHFVTIKGVRAGSSRENLRFSSWMSDQYY